MRHTADALAGRRLPAPRFIKFHRASSFIKTLVGLHRTVPSPYSQPILTPGWHFNASQNEGSQYASEVVTTCPNLFLRLGRQGEHVLFGESVLVAGEFQSWGVTSIRSYVTVPSDDDVAGGIAGEHRLNDCTELSGYLAAKDHEEALEATDRHAGRRFLPLAGKLEVATI